MSSKKPEDYELFETYSAEDMPAEAFRPYIRFSEELFERLKRNGNSKDEVHVVLESMLRRMQDVVIDNAKEFSSADSMQWTAGHLVVVALIRVAFRNPLYGSEALTLQLNQEIRSILGESKGMVIEKGAK